jgi:hypothetical protein
MPRAVITLILLIVLLLPGAVFAQDTPIDHLEIAMWPEYDRQAVLVIYRFQLSPDSQLPMTISLPIPASVGEPHAVAWRDEAGRLLVADYTLESSGDWANVLVQMESLTGQLEFYVDLSIAGADRSFRVSWPGDVPVSALTYEVQQPVGASDLVIDPPPQGQSIGQDGLLYSRGSLATTGPISIQTQYQKQSDDLSAEIPALVQPDVPSGGSNGIDPNLPWIVGGIGLTMLAVGGFFYLRLSRGQTPSPSRRRRRRTRGESSQVEIDASPLYCQSCGTRASASDIYCRQCGTKLRQR